MPKVKRPPKKKRPAESGKPKLRDPFKRPAVKLKRKLKGGRKK